jgi:predicted alpha/beta-hydrolase family hydrolase
MSMPLPAEQTWTNVQTRNGTATFHLDGVGTGLLVLGHGAGGGTRSVDLLAARAAAHDAGFRVALVEQPWRVRGRKVAEAPAKLDLAWVDVLAALAEQLADNPATPLVCGGRSAGARVACRTAAEVGADAVLCLAFPLHPPGKPERTRLPELQGVDVPVLVVQGERDAFGVPPGATVVPGADHGFRVAKGLPGAGPQVHQHVRAWLAGLAAG